MKGIGNINKLMKQAQQMQAKMAAVQEELAEREVEASAGGGAVTVRMNGRQEVLGVKIQPDIVDPEDVEALEDAIVAALREAHKQSTELMQAEMDKASGGLNLPGMF